MKYAIVIMGGAADRPGEGADGKTPLALALAKAPALKRMGQTGRLGQAAMLAEDVEPGADTAMMALLGYDPAKRYTGPAPLTALGLGLDLPKQAWAMHLSLLSAPGGVLLASDDEVLPAAEAQALIREMLPALELPGAVVHPGPGAMHILIDEGRDEDDPPGAYRDWSPLVTAPPRVILDQPIREHLPLGEMPGERMQQLIAQSSVALASHDINAARQEMGEPAVTHLWPWGQGQDPALRSWQERFGLSAAIISHDAAIRGLALAAGLDASQPPPTDSVKGDLIRLGADAVEAVNLYDLVIVHADAPALAGYDGNPADKRQAIQLIDEHVLKPVAHALEARGEHRLMATPLYATPADDRRDDPMAVPFVITGYKMAGIVPRDVTEAAAETCDLQVPFGHELMEYFLKSGVRG